MDSGRFLELIIRIVGIVAIVVIIFVVNYCCIVSLFIEWPVKC